MRKYIFIFMVFVLPAAVVSGEIALVYESEQDVLTGQSFMGHVAGDGILMRADMAKKSNYSPLLGMMNGDLKRGGLVRLDTDLNLALIRAVEVISDKALMKAHLAKVEAYRGFIPKISSAGTGSLEPIKKMDVSMDPFLAKINGSVVGKEPIVLSVKRKKSHFKLEVVRVSTSSVWRVDVRLKSEPKIRFWKKGRKKGLNDIPRPEFKYHYQAMFKPLKPGASFTVPIEVFNIKQNEYNWILELNSKSGSFKKTIPIKFES